MNPIKERISKHLTGEEELSSSVILTIQEHIKDVISAGIEADADAMIYALRIGGKVYVAVLVGKSLLQAEELNRYLRAYFDNAKGFERHLPKIVDYVYGDLRGKTDAYMVLREENKDRWRAFRPLLNVDDVYAKMGM